MQQAGWVVSEREDEGSNKSTNKENREQTRKIRLEESEQKTETTDYFSTPCFFLVKLWINDNTSQFHNSHEIPGLHAVQSPIVSYQSARLARGQSVARTLLPARREPDCWICAHTNSVSCREELLSLLPLYQPGQDCCCKGTFSPTSTEGEGLVYEQMKRLHLTRMPCCTTFTHRCLPSYTLTGLQ